MVTELLTQNGLRGDGTVEHVAGVDIYPPEWFNPYDDLTGRLRKTQNTHTIHWFAKSWMEPEPMWQTTIKRLFRRVLGKNALAKLRSFLKK